VPTTTLGLIPSTPPKPHYRINHTDSHQSPEYLASKARLLAAQEQAAYNRLLNPASTPSPDHQDPHATPSNTQLIAEDTLTPSLVINIFLSVLITGFSTYWALTMFTMPEILATTFASWTGPRVDGSDTGGGASAAVKVLVSLFAALAVAVAESFLYAAYLGKVERARVRERRMKERKTVLGAVAEDGRVAGVERTEEIEIWGKGVNGGVRRRVREKWEKGKEMGEGLS
jgi:TMEM199 family protein